MNFLSWLLIFFALSGWVLAFYYILIVVPQINYDRAMLRHQCKMWEVYVDEAFNKQENPLSDGKEDQKNQDSGVSE
jgi:hypothetical protein